MTNISKEELKIMITEHQKNFKTNPLRHTQNCIMSNWEYRLLTRLDAITPQGFIKYNYPVVKISKSDGDERYEDLGGDIMFTRKAVDDFNAENKKEKATIYYYPKIFILFKEAYREIKENEDKAEKIEKAKNNNFTNLFNILQS